MKKQKDYSIFKNAIIALIGAVILNLVIYALNKRLGFGTNSVFLIIVTLYSWFTLYTFLSKKIQWFNKIYMFIVSILTLAITITEHYIAMSIPEEKKDDFKQVRELDIYNSKAIYLIGNITILSLLYFTFVYNVSSSYSIILLVILILGLTFPIFYIPLYEIQTFKISKIDIIKLILMLILLVITCIVLFYFKVNAIIVLVYFSILMSLILSIDNKKFFFYNLILLIIFILIPILIILWLM